MSDKLRMLRDRTAGLHAQLDKEVMKDPVTSDDGYRKFLLMHARILPTVENWLSGRPIYHTLIGWEGRLRTSALMEDLKCVGAAPPPALPLTFLNDKTSIVGICYVLEGSRLGGAMLSGMLRKAACDQPMSFLLHGQEDRFWTTFLQWIETADGAYESADNAAAAAVTLFETYLKAVRAA